MELLIQNLVSPVVLAFLLGIIARMVRSDLEIPSAIYQGLSIYLLLAIGLKGGVALSQTPPAELVGPVLLTLALGVLTPFSAFILLRKLGKLGRIDAAATAAHYGSVSAVTFVAAIEAVKHSDIPAAGYLPALVAVLEVPGIIVGLLLARQSQSGGIKSALHEVLTGKSIFLMLGGLIIGTVCGAEKVSTIAPFFIDPFKGVLFLFLLELGIVAASRFRDLAQAGWRLVLTGCLLPTLHGTIATTAATYIGMSTGSAAVFGAMVASASYIAAPAAVRIALPKASPGIYLTMALGVTFPFNLAIGIPLFLKLAQLTS
ncbi:sodium-dependent bicarbonate transport family permease [Sulfuriroseicoccus oceanibius]|uniref:Sodium-dependent bicarbonate transport family permease n=1 Tax=Sulfuriroseicoccus oceanibius TaxID=2707525 RepID=A0A6B3LAU3_9BACT|nr:sodium-dependent bicarbonate transport family permease [Sulfuriroseicoccus oceanibius]QQL45577.1 sodium-dependent bicarbonate transport family permease [Sulfuriroseicoccus oceanibius]